MKIVDVCAFYAPKGGGVRTYIDRKLVEGPRAGHEIVVIAPGSRSWTEHRGPGARIVWIKSPKFPLDPNYHYFGDAAVLHAVLDSERPDVVEVSSPWRSASMVAAWRSTAVRTLVMHADPLAAYAYRWFEMLADRPAVDRGFEWYWRHLRRLDAGFDSVVTASRSLTERLEAGGLHHVSTIAMGVEPGVFSPRRRDLALRARLLAMCGLGPEATLLIGVGRHAPEKRWPMIVDAVTSAQFSAAVGLVLVGDGRERSRIAAKIGANPHIRMLKPTNNRAELARLMASADALIHGCEAETFCMVAAEALASGLELIVPDTGGAADQLAGRPGRLFTPASAAAAAREIVAFAEDRRAGASVPQPVEPRTMRDHFEELFAHYSQLAKPLRVAA
ncbi:glycosyltransferase [Sphingosinicellaceae bacterium]|nr:glycosyltransferase [Sphingosinicellaceae bacterium]